MVREDLGDERKGPGEKIVQTSDKCLSGLDEMAIQVQKKITHQKKRALEAHATHLDNTGFSGHCRQATKGLSGLRNGWEHPRQAVEAHLGVLEAVGRAEKLVCDLFPNMEC